MTMFDFIYKYLFLILFTCSFGLYAIQHLIVAYFFKTQNLRKRYNAQWALVTGSSSGIGKSVAFKLARQGLNVVLVALGDPVLDATFDEIKAAFPKLQFRKVPADLGREGYLEQISKATDDIRIQIVFCNAGYLLTGFFHERSLSDNMANLNCNAISAVQITHHFARKLVADKLGGCFVYTSSAAASMPGPFSAQYAATKSFLSAFGASIAPELRPHGIDVLVFHPSPVQSRFYDKVHKLDMLDFFKKFAVSPDDLPDTVFASVGRTILRDVGPTAVAFRLIPKIVDYNFIAFLTALFGPMLPDFKREMAAIAAASADKAKSAAAAVGGSGAGKKDM